MKPWWDTCLINNGLMKKISLALRRGKQLREQERADNEIHTADDVPTLRRDETR